MTIDYIQFDLPAAVAVLVQGELDEDGDGEKDDRVAGKYEAGRWPLDERRGQGRVRHDGRQSVGADHDESG